MAGRESSTGIAIRSFVDKQGYVSYLVQGWNEDGKWRRKQPRNRVDAESFAALKKVEQENQGRSQRMILSPLTDSQAEEALQAFDKLGGAYSLTEAVGCFLKHHRPPEFTIRFRDAVKLYRDEKERDGLRPRSLQSIAWTLESFAVDA